MGGEDRKAGTGLVTDGGEESEENVTPRFLPLVPEWCFSHREWRSGEGVATPSL